LRKAIEYEPDNKEALYALGQCYFELSNNGNALKIFTHLRTDPRFGPHAALYAGTINLNTHAYDRAVLDLTIGLRHEGLKINIEKELKYRLALAYIKLNQIEKALVQLREILQVDVSYKDVKDLVEKYQELSKNKLLQVYMVAPTSEFVTLCRRIASTFYSNSKAKLVDIQIVKNEYIDIQAEVNTPKWEDVVLFRFLRSEGVVGELTVRELYLRCRDLRAGRGLCFAVGEYSKSAEEFVEARLVDLIDKEGLLKIFDKLPVPAMSRGHQALAAEA
jgi:tetratricopeptide (TPR) repeat protein